jgi:hypothetical protein
MPSDWYVALDGKSYGPFDDARIRSLAKEGRIQPETLVSRAGMQNWVAARHVKGLFPAGQVAVRLPEAARPQNVEPETEVSAVVSAPDIESSSAVPLIRTAGGGVRKRITADIDYTINIALGLGGAGALLLGFFCPILKLPIVGSMSYLSFVGLLVRDGAVSEMTISAFLVMAAIVVAVIAALMKSLPLFWIPGAGGIGAVLLTLVKYFGVQRKMGRGIEKDLDGNPFAGLAKAMVQAVSLDVGVAVVVIGAALLIAAAVVPPRKRA